MKRVFNDAGEFAAMNAAEAWCAAHGISVGVAQRGDPRGLLFGDVVIMKWRNLDGQERAALHGAMTGDGRHGPVTVTLKDDAVRLHAPALADEFGLAHEMGGAS